MRRCVNSFIEPEYGIYIGTSSLYSCLVVQVGNLNTNVLSTASWSAVIFNPDDSGSDCFGLISSPPCEGSNKRYVHYEPSHMHRKWMFTFLVGNIKRFSDFCSVVVGDAVSSKRNSSGCWWMCDLC
jgi:hypothetical protein